MLFGVESHECERRERPETPSTPSKKAKRDLGGVDPSLAIKARAETLGRGHRGGFYPTRAKNGIKGGGCVQVEPNGVQNNSRQHIRGLVRTPSIHYLSFPIGTAKHLTAQARDGARLVSLCGDPRFPSLTSSITRLVLFPLHCCARPKSETLILGWSTTREHISQSVDQSVNITSVSGILSAVSFLSASTLPGSASTDDTGTTTTTRAKSSHRYPRRLLIKIDSR